MRNLLTLAQFQALVSLFAEAYIGNTEPRKGESFLQETSQATCHVIKENSQSHRVLHLAQVKWEEVEERVKD